MSANNCTWISQNNNGCSNTATHTTTTNKEMCEHHAWWYDTTKDWTEKEWADFAHDVSEGALAYLSKHLGLWKK